MQLVFSLSASLLLCRLTNEGELHGIRILLCLYRDVVYRAMDYLLDIQLNYYRNCCCHVRGYVSVFVVLIMTMVMACG